MARTKIDNSTSTYPLPVTTTGHGFGNLIATRQAAAGRQDRDLQRFNGKKGPRGTQESISTLHGIGPIGKYGKG